MLKETSETVSSLAAIWIDCKSEDLEAYYENDETLEDLAKIIRTFAASCLSQDETSETE